MIFLKRKRLIFWLLRAYLKKWGKIIVFSFIVGFVLFLLLFLNRNFLISKLPITQNQTIGISGVYTRRDLPNNLPDVVSSQVSRGLTKISSKGEVLPDLAKSWEIKDDGKTFIFYLRDDISFSDKKKFDSNSINYNFEDVSVERPGKYVIVFKLKDKYSPFLVTLASYKVFKKNYVGTSDYKVSDLETNGEFVRSIELLSQKDKKIIKYVFYDTQEALKNAYVLGEVTSILDINTLSYSGKDLGTFKNTKALKNINYDKMVTIFYNNTDPILSDKKIRKALAYSLPDSFTDGQRTYTPYRNGFWFNNSSENYQKDIEYAKILLSETEASKSGELKIEIKSLPQYKSLAEKISLEWKKIGIITKISTVDGVPSSYQAFLGELPVLKDPDQYTLWHTGQESNITNYRNLRIDKLLEDGRRTYDLEERKKIYADFQKYLIDDMPATFLFFPYTYTLTRK